MKKLLFLLLPLCFLVLLFGCQTEDENQAANDPDTELDTTVHQDEDGETENDEKQEDTPAENQTASTPTTQAPPSTTSNTQNVTSNTLTSEVSTNLRLSVERFTDAEVNQLTNANRFTDVFEGHRDTGINIGFTFSQDVTNFKFIAISHGSGDRLEPYVVAELLSPGHIPAWQTIVLEKYWELGTMPHRGFSFTDSAGVTHWYLFQESQKDGSIHYRSFPWNTSYGIARWVSDTYTVARGDTLFSIATAHHTTVEHLQDINNMGSSTQITVGQTLNVSTGRFVIDGN